MRKLRTRVGKEVTQCHWTLWRPTSSLLESDRPEFQLWLMPSLEIWPQASCSPNFSEPQCKMGRRAPSVWWLLVMFANKSRPRAPRLSVTPASLVLESGGKEQLIWCWPFPDWLASERSWKDRPVPGENWREELLSRSVGGAQRSPQGAQVGTGVDHWAGTPVSLLGTAMEPGL